MFGNFFKTSDKAKVARDATPISVQTLLNLSKQSLAEYLLSLANDSVPFAVLHPEFAIETFARCSRADGMANIVQFSDAAGTNPWYLIQRKNFIDAYCTETHIDNITGSRDTEKLVNNIRRGVYRFENNVEQDKLSGFLFSHSRPYHFFYDQCVNYFYLSRFGDINEKCFTDGKCFSEITDQGAFKRANSQGTYLFPVVEGSNYSSNEAEEMHQYFRNKAAEVESDFIKTSPDGLVIWIGVTGQKRKWLGQIRGYAKILGELAKNYPSVDVFIDGWTNYLGDTSNNLEDSRVIRQLQLAMAKQLPKKIQRKINLKSLVSASFINKVRHVSECDVYIANNGTGAMVPQLIGELQGVQHGNGKVNSFRKSYDERVKRVAKSCIRKSVGAANHSTDYFIHWTHIYNLLASFLAIPNVPEQQLTNEDMIVDLFDSIGLTPNLRNEEVLAKVGEAFSLIGDSETANTITSVVALMDGRLNVASSKISVFDVPND